MVNDVITAMSVSLDSVVAIVYHHGLARWQHCAAQRRLVVETRTSGGPALQLLNSDCGHRQRQGSTLQQNRTYFLIWPILASRLIGSILVLCNDASVLGQGKIGALVYGRRFLALAKVQELLLASHDY